MRLLLIGAFTPANLGDGAIVSQMIAETKRVFGEQCTVTVSATDPEAFKQLIGIDSHGRLIDWSPLGTWPARLKWLASTARTAVPVWLTARRGRTALERLVAAGKLPISTQQALEEILLADLVISVGGGYLSDPYRRQFPFWFLEHLCAHVSGAPLVFFSQSFGPTDKWISKFFLRKSLALSSAFIARDEVSADRFRRLTTRPTTITVCADVALLAPVVEPVEHRHRTIGISLLRWANYTGNQEDSHAAYVEAVRSAIAVLLLAEPDLHVRLYATNCGVGRNAMDDVAVCREMQASLSSSGLAERCTVAPWTADVATYCSDVAGCELLVASRMHSAVLAITQGVPVMGIAYEEKMFGLLEMLGTADHCVRIDEPKAIELGIAGAWRSRHLIRVTSKDRLPELRRSASEAMELCRQVYDLQIGTKLL